MTVPANAVAIPATASTHASSATYNVLVQGDREPAVDGANLFTVHVLGLRHIRLVPKNGLGRALLNSWLGADVKLTARYVGASCRAPSDDRLTELAIEFEHWPMLTERGDPFATGDRLTPWEFTAAKEAVQRETAKRVKVARAEIRKRRKEAKR